MADLIRTRPHHFLDIIAAYGSGKEKWEPAASGNHVHVVAQKALANRDVMLEFMIGIDDICRPCRRHKDGHCGATIGWLGGSSMEEYNDALDARLYKRLGLADGMRMSASEFLRLVREQLGNPYEIWKDPPREDTDRRVENLMAGIAEYLGQGHIA